MAKQRIPKPEWLKIDLRNIEKMAYVNTLLQNTSLNTVCKEANCPNRLECYGKRTAAFMILGNVCTRQCRFCNVEGGSPQPVDKAEPQRLAAAVAELKLKHVVVTSVSRDDLPDYGAFQFAETARAIKAAAPGTVVELLIPDFQGSEEALNQVLESGVSILNHNVETVPRLYADIRPDADYKQSLEVLARVKRKTAAVYTKSGLMLGLGETETEVLQTLEDLRAVTCDFLTIGQYLQPSRRHQPVVEYIHPDVFAFYKEKAESLGFLFVASAPLVRSSYHAEDFYQKFMTERGK